MSHRAEVLAAVKALVAIALPDADVIGLENSADRPIRIGPGGTVVIRDGDPGEPMIDLSPTTYHFDHNIPLELYAIASPNVSTRERLDQMAMAIDAQVQRGRTLGGLCNFIDTTPLEITDLTVLGGASQVGGQFDLTASYTTASPLG